MARRDPASLRAPAVCCSGLSCAGVHRGCRRPECGAQIPSRYARGIPRRAFHRQSRPDRERQRRRHRPALRSSLFRRVRTLLLTNCDTEPDSPPAAVLPVIELGRAGRFADEWLVPWLADKKLARSAKGLGGQCYADPAHPTDEAVETYLRPLVDSQQRKALTNAYAVGLHPNPLAGVEAALKRSAAPVRIVWGTADSIFSQASPDYLDRSCANSRGVRRVPGAKLFFPEEMPELIAEEAIGLWHPSR